MSDHRDDQRHADRPAAVVRSARSGLVSDHSHYIELDPDTPHGGETRRQRLAEFHEENTLPVIGLREGSWLEVKDSVILQGPHTALLFRRGFEAVEFGPGEISQQYLRNNAPLAK